MASSSTTAAPTETNETPESLEKLLKSTRIRYESVNQGHVLQYYDSLSTIEQKQALLHQLRDIPVESLSSLLSSAQSSSSSKESDDDGDDIRPFSGIIGRSSSSSSEKDGEEKEWYTAGMNAIRQNQVAAVLLAGGQGTRLGFSGPKGMYDIGMPSGRSLFQWIMERLVKLIQLAANNSTTTNTTTKVRIPLYIMTSPMNHKETQTYLQSNSYFGLPPEDVQLFPQDVLPCLSSSSSSSSSSGKILLQTPYQCAMAPNGNGGIYPAMDKCGILNDMKRRGIIHIHAFAIDNALVRPADPIFIGFCHVHGADCGNKSVWKSGPHEKVGVVAERRQIISTTTTTTTEAAATAEATTSEETTEKGQCIKEEDKNQSKKSKNEIYRPCIVEYSDITKEMAELVDETNNNNKKKLIFGAGNICNHYYTLDFLLQDVIPNFHDLYHVANKKIPIWDESQQKTITPSTTKNNGIKLETFIFDVFPLSKNMTVLDVSREYEFSPVKNAPGNNGTDNPNTARSMLSSMFRQWLLNVNAKLEGDLESDQCEISPLVSYGGEGLDMYKGKTIVCPFRL